MRNVKILMVFLLMYGIGLGGFKVFTTLSLSDISKENYYGHFLNFLKSKGSHKTLIHRQGEMLNYTDYKVQHVFDAQTAHLLKNPEAINDFDYVLYNTYNDPLFYGTPLQKRLYDPQKSALIYDALGFKVFDLRSSVRTKPLGFDLQMAFVDMDQSSYLYVSHKDEYPSMMVAPDAHRGEFLNLMPGLYDYGATFEIDATDNALIYCERIVLQDQKVRAVMEDTFYLRPGKNRVQTRFFGSSQPYRLTLKSSKSLNNVRVHLEARPLSDALEGFSVVGKESFLFFMHQKRTEISQNLFLKYANASKNKQKITFKLKGYGEFYVCRPLKIVSFMPKIFFEIQYIRKIIKKFFSSDAYAIGEQEKTLEVLVDRESSVYFDFLKKGDYAFVIEDVRIEEVLDVQK